MAFEDAKKFLTNRGAGAMLGKNIRVESFQLKFEGQVVAVEQESGFVSLRIDSGQTLKISHPGYSHSFFQGDDKCSFHFNFRYCVIGSSGIHNFNEKAEVET